MTDKELALLREVFRDEMKKEIEDMMFTSCCAVIKQARGGVPEKAIKLWWKERMKDV